MKRSLSTTTLVFASVSAILGSGWLFSAFYTASLAGAASLIAWLLGGLAIIIVAFTFAELSAMIPIMGSSTRIPHYTHGTIVSFIFSWLIWLSYMAMVPIEVQAIMQYISYYYPSLIHTSSALTHQGYLVTTVLMLVVSVLNVFSLRWLIRANNFLTVLKLVIPVFICIVVLSVCFSPEKVLHPAHTVFSPFGWHGILSALTAGGILFAFNGFKQACEMAGEAKRPSRALPIAIIGSIVICLAIYLLLQLAFLCSLHSSNLADGWRHIHLRSIASPFSSILVQDKLSWLLPILYVGAIIGPLAAAFMYANSSSRALYGTSKNGYIPVIFQKLTAHGNPIVAIITNFVVGMCLFAPLPGWDKMITFLTSIVTLTYAIAPICLVVLRKQLPDQKRPFKLPCGKLWSLLAFYICTLMVYWSGWDIISKLCIALLLGLVVLLIYHFGSKRGRQIQFNVKAANWLWPYLIGITLISYYGSFGHGQGVIPFGWDFAIIAIFCIMIMWLAVKFSLPQAEIQQQIAQLNLGEKNG